VKAMTRPSLADYNHRGRFDGGDAADRALKKRARRAARDDAAAQLDDDDRERAEYDPGEGDPT